MSHHKKLYKYIHTDDIDNDFSYDDDQDHDDNDNNNANTDSNDNYDNDYDNNKNHNDNGNSSKTNDKDYDGDDNDNDYDYDNNCNNNDKMMIVTTRKIMAIMKIVRRFVVSFCVIIVCGTYIYKYIVHMNTYESNVHYRDNASRGTFIW